jgi:hypothetical protein
MKAYRENSSAHWMGLLKKYRATTFEKAAKNMRTIKIPDRISSKYFTENRTRFMPQRPPTEIRKGGRKNGSPSPLPFKACHYFAASTTFS